MTKFNIWGLRWAVGAISIEEAVGQVKKISLVRLLCLCTVVKSVLRVLVTSPEIFHQPIEIRELLAKTWHSSKNDGIADIAMCMHTCTS